MLRIGLGVYALLCARKDINSLMTTPASTPTFVKDEDFTFSGEQLRDWFRFDRIVASLCQRAEDAIAFRRGRRVQSSRRSPPGLGESARSRPEGGRGIRGH